MALPVKLLDSIAAGRPVVVTPRRETVAIVERHEIGVVSAGDSVDDMADALRQLLVDPERARRVGAHARRVAEAWYDWDVVGDRIASAVLEREGALGA